MTENSTSVTNKEFIFLCVVDNSPELSRALRFSCKRAKRVGGRVALAYVIPPAEFQHWLGVGELMQEEAREDAETLLDAAAKDVVELTGKLPMFFVRQGNTATELIELINEEDTISLLVLGAASGKDGPGPLVKYMVENAAGKLQVPVTIVPGNLTDEHIDSIT
ncbi:MAG: universal stress protein [Magnetovibrio sp.]|nr:universal stress protein [Magnetovibrio sp.]